MGEINGRPLPPRIIPTRDEDEDLARYATRVLWVGVSVGLLIVAMGLGLAGVVAHFLRKWW